jgi:hypothetical protein
MMPGVQARDARGIFREYTCSTCGITTVAGGAIRPKLITRTPPGDRGITISPRLWRPPAPIRIRGQQWEVLALLECHSRNDDRTWPGFALASVERPQTDRLTSVSLGLPQINRNSAQTDAGLRADTSHQIEAPIRATAAVYPLRPKTGSYVAEPEELQARLTAFGRQAKHEFR